MYYFIYHMTQEEFLSEYVSNEAIPKFEFNMISKERPISFCERYYRWAQALIALVRKRYRPQDVGKKLQFLNTYNEFLELYERAKAQETNLTAKNKAKDAQRSNHEA